MRSLQKFIETDLTSDERGVLLRNLAPEFAARFSSPILPTETIPVTLLNRVTEEAARAKSEPLESFGRRAGAAAAADAVKGIYRFFARVITARAMLSKASTMWSSLYNQGKLSVVEQTSNSARLVLADFPSDLAFCARFAGWLEGMARLTGQNDVKIEHPKCTGRGGPCCEWKVTWK